MQTSYYSIFSTRIVKNSLLLAFTLLLSSIFFATNLNAQTLLDNYDASGTLSYTTEGSWLENGGVYEGKTGGVTTPEHSYAAYDLSNSFSGYNLNKANTNTWFGWIDFNRGTLSGWGESNYSSGMVLTANSSDFNATTTSGYAAILRNSPDELVIIRFDNGITSGATNLPDNSVEIVSSNYTYSDLDNGVNFFVEYLADGTWKISYLAGAQISDVNSTDKLNYFDGNATSAGSDETYTGTDYKYSGWIYAHATATELAFYDNFGAGYTDNLPPVATWDPIDSETGVAIASTPSITFDEAIRNIDDSEITNANVATLLTFKKTNASGADVSFTASIDVDKKVITLTPSASLDFSQAYYAALASVEDVSDNAFSTENITFTTIDPEPTNQATTFVSTADSHKDITNTWADNNGAQIASGFLLMINLTGTFSTPVDGVPQADDTDISDGDGVVNVAHGDETYTWADLDSNQGYYFEIYAYNSSGDNINYKTDGTVPTSSATTSATPDSDSKITDPTSQIAATTISSLADTDGEALDVFSFKITDIGGTDALATIVDTIRVRPHTTNTTDWTDHIQGVKLDNGSAIGIDNVAITDSYIDITITSGDLTIGSGGSSEVTLSIYLNTSNIEDGEILSFYIDDEAHGFVADEYGSTFTTDALTAEVVSNDFTIGIVATKLVFNSMPSDINENVNFSVEVWATDTNDNLDIDETSSITLTEDGGGDLTGSLTQSLSGGTYTWTDVKYSTTGSFNLTADDAGSLTLVSSSITSYATGVATPGSIIISEFMADPSSVSDANGEWIELYNSNTFVVDIDGWAIKDDGGENHTINNGGTLNIPVTGFLVIGLNSTTPDNGNYTADYVYAGIGLTNTADEIVLTNASATEISRVNYDTGNGWTITAGSSLIFTGTASDDNNDATLWTTSTLREKGYLGTSLTDNGSPGRNGFEQDFVSTATWTGTGNWSEGNLVGNTNWDNGVPGPNTDVTINGTVTVDVSTPATCNDLTISSGNTLTISAGNALTVYGDLANNNGSASGLYLDANSTSVSSLITNGTISGDATVISYFTDISKYYIVSPPISNALGAVFTGDVVYYYDEPNYMWQNPTNLDFSFGVGIGYAIYKNTGNTVTYSGTLNTGAVSNTLTYADNGNDFPVDGWNLMGNPYPSVLDISYLDYTDISNGVWVNLHNSASDYYVYWSKTLGTVGSSGEGGGDDRARYIQPGQGFWIYTDVDGTAFNLSNSMRTHQNQGVFSKSAEANTDTLDKILKISVSGNDIVDPAYILFRSNASLDFDRDYDLLKMTSSGATIPHIFSLTGEDQPKRLAINAIDKPQSETVVPLGLKIGTDGTYRLYFDGMNSFEETQDFYLRDRLNGELFDIRLQPIIEFTHSTSNDEHRFDLVMGLQTDINNTVGISLPAEVYSFRNTLYIRPAENQKVKNIEVKNLLGQTVYSSTFTNSFKTGIQLNLPTAFYLVDIQLESGSYSKKIFIQNLN